MVVNVYFGKANVRLANTKHLILEMFQLYICYLKYLSACGVKYPVSLLWNYIRNLYLKCMISPHFIILFY